MSETVHRLEPLERRPLTDRTCLVTGSSRGIGRDIAFELARAGADVAVNYRSAEDRALEVTSTIEENGETAVPVQADISDPTQVERMAVEVREELGEIDVLVNNAGITIDRKFEDMTYEDWRQVIDVNLTGTFNCTKAFYEDIKASNHGRLINISSVVGQQGNYGQANYATSKGGLFAFTRTLALELASHGSTANCVAPGFTRTDMLEKVPERVQEKIREDIPLGRFATTEDIVGMIRFLTSDYAEYMTGQVIGINGGMEW
ncbi:short-chain dehydrogenase/reductase SDR [Haloterrigena turkmenica DSM 5511]|uniref:Short-chain dehydrogenase/reductase SDR n=1 Tax=Haloterrigena turkmenica (strain ATCC 51198 / DSM 5511 / JCM 9101 / NCIMB 13204 / VKM B-1734 / 4k) TaxID=543526 RepID=D2RYJ0_HALTV|nr:3-oxoacyl-ACP reductase family protein [Haloterrigena turkmenica]ADB59891.1 short-chain dehydrogenase/reductase SDR [Haloterrigena turkmenica DSM 5511]